MEELEHLCLLNNGAPTRLPNGNGKPNPLDLTFVSDDLLNLITWEVKTENLDSDHLLVGMEVEFGMNDESIKCKPKVDKGKFEEGLLNIEVSDIDTMENFLKTINDVKNDATTRPAMMKNKKFVPKSYWTSEISVLHKKKKSAMIKYFRQIQKTERDIQEEIETKAI